MAQQSPKRRVLKDHQQRGTRFIPPFLQLLGPLRDVKWIDRIVPELLWIGLLNEYHGLRKGADLALQFSRACQRHGGLSEKWLAPATVLGSMSVEAKAAVASALASRGLLDSIASALLPLLTLYPKCPLAFLLSGSIPILDHPLKGLVGFKRFLTSILDRHGEASTFMQANAIYMAFDAGALKAFSDTALANFPAVQYFPTTEESRRVAAAVRATTSGLFGSKFPEEPTAWAAYFWNRGLELEGCDVNE